MLCVLQINERGSWRNVVSVFDAERIDDVKAGVSLLAAATRHYSWRIRGVQHGEVLWQMRGPLEGEPMFEWKYRPFEKLGPAEE